MNNDEAKFILTVYRPGGQDATDPLFADALAQARRDPALSVWFKSQVAFDSFVSAKISEVQPPPGLRESILAGARVSRRPASLWQRLLWIAAALIVIAVALLAVRWTASPRPELADLTHFALYDTAIDGMNHLGSVPAMRTIEERLAESRLQTNANLNLDLARLRADGCRTVRAAGHEVFEICFGRDHEFHLYIVRRGDFTAGSNEPVITSAGRFAAAAWTDSRLAYSLVTTAGASALRQRL